MLDGAPRQACKCLDFVPMAGYTATPSVPPVERPGDWTWAQPPREPSKPAVPPGPKGYGGV